MAKASGNAYGSLVVEDFGGELTVMLMGKTYAEFAPKLQTDQVVVVRGRVSRRDDGISLHAYNVDILDAPAEAQGPVIIAMNESDMTRSNLTEIERILRVHAGSEEVRIALLEPTGVRMFELEQRVKITADLYGELKQLLGPNCIRFDGAN